MGNNKKINAVEFYTGLPQSRLLLRNDNGGLIVYVPVIALSLLFDEVKRSVAILKNKRNHVKWLSATKAQDTKAKSRLHASSRLLSTIK